MTTATLLNAVSATGASRSIGTDCNLPAFVQVTGITSATAVVQGSVDNTNWSTLATALTADGLVTIATPPPFIRVNVTVYVSGTITAKISY